MNKTQIRIIMWTRRRLRKRPLSWRLEIVRHYYKSTGKGNEIKILIK